MMLYDYFVNFLKAQVFAVSREITYQFHYSICIREFCIDLSTLFKSNEHTGRKYLTREVCNVYRTVNDTFLVMYNKPFNFRHSYCISHLHI